MTRHILSLAACLPILAGCAWAWLDHAISAETGVEAVAWDAPSPCMLPAPRVKP